MRVAGYEECMSETIATTKHVWSASELAEALGVTVQYVRRLIRNGVIAHYRIGVEGRRIFIPGAEAEALLTGRHPAVKQWPTDAA
jgi:excisionase family DNA binding protein